MERDKELSVIVKALNSALLLTLHACQYTLGMKYCIWVGVSTIENYPETHTANLILK